MKKLLIVITLLVLILSGCKKQYYYYDYDDLMNNYIKFEIVDATCISEPCIGQFIKGMPDEMIEEFCLDLSKIKFEILRAPPTRPEGTGFRISTNEYYEVVALGRIERFNSRNEFIYGKYIGFPRELKDLIEKYS